MSLWTDERVDETVNSAYVHSHLRPNEQELLQRPLYFGGDLTDDTYLDWILTRAKRFFLILVATGVPDQIFGIIDDSYDDEDLPIVEQAVVELRLSYEPDRSLDKRFYKNQFRFLTRVLGEGEHIRYADEETVPVVPVNLKSVVLSLGHEGSDRIRLPSAAQKLLVRRRIKLESQLTEEDILNEIATSRRLCHEHVVSVFGSYLHQGSFNVLSTPAPEWTLKTFLSDTPKSFSALPKTDRRKILINWPHCLANALAWLHENGEYHGAIRPSNIQVDESFSISLGLLEGDGLLRVQTKSDDIEAYQYGPPERWKRAVTVQSTGSAAYALPSGGRSGRRTGGSGRNNVRDGKNPARSGSASSTATFTYQPTSRGNYARLRLHSTPSPQGTVQLDNRYSEISSPGDNRSVSSHGTARRAFDPAFPMRAPSILSASTGSDGKHAKVSAPSPMFVASPEGRSAFVQTWQSVEQDMFASDIFSLGAVIMDVLNVLCKRSHGSFQRHRSSKNRMAGRGGGLADASFHANLTQVFVWAQGLQTDAEKKAKKNEGEVYPAVGSIVQLALQCLEREPSARLTSAQLERKVGEHLRRFARIEQLHCLSEQKIEAPQRSMTLPIRETNTSAQAMSRQRSEDRLRQQHQNTSLPSINERQQTRQERFVQDDPPRLGPVPTVASSVTTTPGASVTSLLSFNFDGVSDTVVAESPQSRDQSIRRTRTRDETSTPVEQVPWSNEQQLTPRQKYWNNWHNNDSQVDPRLSFGESVDTGAFTYLNYSTSASSEDEARPYFPRPPTERPPKPPPNRGLPPVPPLPTKIRNTKPNQRVPRHKISNENATILKGGSEVRPLRMDSLPKEVDFDEDDYHNAIRQTRRPRDVKVASRSKPRQDHYLVGSPTGA
jgi:serine/threonine protein kinase